jgi:starch-binding outer membrane protein, SusD/RagB family
MYKSIIKITLLLALMFTVSCSEDFLEVENKNQLTDENFYQTQEDFWMALNSLYTPLAHGGMYGLNWQFVFGSFEDRILFETTGMDMLTVNSSTGQIQSVYGDLYKGIYRVNIFIQKLNERQDIEGLTDQMRREYLGQAKALRAAYNFYLVTIFNAPPFYDDQTIPVDFNILPTNGRPEQFWSLINEDLIYAKDNLPLSWASDDVGRITSGAAAAMLGKAMLYKHYYYYVRLGQKGSGEDIADLQVARDALLQVINSGQHELIKPLAPKTRNDYIYALLSNTSFVDLPAGDNIYPSENNKESVWEIQYSDERIAQGWLPGWQWTGTLNFQYFSGHPDSFRNHEAHPDLWDAYETEGAPEGFDRDPRAYATMFLDNDTMDFRQDSPFYNSRYRSGINNKRVARGRGLIPTQNSPYPSTGFGLKKYYYPMYVDKDSPKNDPINRRVIRFADVLLMYAEVTYLLNENTAAGLQALNRVRARVDMPDVETLTPQAIIHERDVELALEGVRWFDLIRWSLDPAWGIDMQQILSRQTGPDGDGSFFVIGKHEFMPIPLYEINLSEGQLIQNPGW